MGSLDTYRLITIVISALSLLMSLALPTTIFLLGKEWLKRIKIQDDNKKLNSEELGFGGGGYIIIDLPNHLHSYFHDLLKGFEEYAKLKGYTVEFSIDKSLNNKIGFKFTIKEYGVSVSTERVKQDLKEYIDKVNKGESIDNLPIIIDNPEHQLILLCLKNRISFLQNTYTIQQNTIELYRQLNKELISKLSDGFNIGSLSPNYNIIVDSDKNQLYTEYSQKQIKELNQSKTKNIMSEQKPEFNISDINLQQGASFVGRDMSGEIKTIINDLPSRSDSEGVGIKELLINLEKEINKEFSSDNQKRDRAIKYLKKLAEAAKNPDKSQEEADMASLAIRGLQVSSAIFSIVNNIRIFFGLSN